MKSTISNLTSALLMSAFARLPPRWRRRRSTPTRSRHRQEFLCNRASNWYTWAMKPPMFIRPLTDDERIQLEADRRTADAFRVRRAQIVLASARRLSPKPIAQLVGWRPAIMASHGEAWKPAGRHQPHHIAGHRALRIGRVIQLRRRLAARPIPAQISAHDREFFCEGRRHAIPHHMGLRKAM